MYKNENWWAYLESWMFLCVSVVCVKVRWTRGAPLLDEGATRVSMPRVENNGSDEYVRNPGQKMPRRRKKKEQIPEHGWIKERIKNEGTMDKTN